MPDGTLVEGIVDLAFEEAGEWTVVDYKTDREIAARRRGPIPASGGALRVGDRAGNRSAGTRCSHARVS